MDDMQRMQSLVDRLNETAYAYYVLDNPTISDAQWDALYDELTALEARTARTLSGVAGAGKVEVTIRTREVAVSSGALGSAQTQQVPCGAVAVAQGADDPQVAMALREALCALLGLPAASVSIVTGGG